MKVVSGTRGSQNLLRPNRFRTRPMMDYVKKVVFNVLTNYLNFVKIKVLDLFAGSGQLGIECLSRQAKQVIFNDNSWLATQIIRKNLEKNNFLKSQFSVWRCDFRPFLAQMGTKNCKFNLIFVDPPFNKMNYLLGALTLIVQLKLLTKNGVIVLQTKSNDVQWPPKLKLKFSRKLKNKYITLLSYA